jgi:hypothetical protein
LRWINQTSNPIKPPAPSTTTIQAHAGVSVALPSPFVVMGARTTAVTDAAVLVAERTLVVTGAGVVETTTVVDVVTVEREGLATVAGGCVNVCAGSGRKRVVPRVAVESLPATCAVPSPSPQPANAMLVRTPRANSAAGANAFATRCLRARLPEPVIPPDCTAEVDGRHRPKGMTTLRGL